MVLVGSIAAGPTKQTQSTSIAIIVSTWWRNHGRSYSTDLTATFESVTGEFPAQRASNAENVSIWWRHHDGVLVTPSLKVTLFLHVVWDCRLLALSNFPPGEYIHFGECLEYPWGNDIKFDVMEFPRPMCPRLPWGRMPTTGTIKDVSVFLNREISS